MNSGLKGTSKKLRIKGSFESQESLVVEPEEAEFWRYDDPWKLVVIENHLVGSYEQLLAVANEERFKDKEALDVCFVHLDPGG